MRYKENTDRANISGIHSPPSTMQISDSFELISALVLSLFYVQLYSCK